MGQSLASLVMPQVVVHVLHLVMPSAGGMPSLLGAGR